MNLTEITSKRFDKSAFGYKPVAVDSFLTELASVVGKLQEENADLKNKLEILASKVEEYRQDESNMKDALLGAQKLGNNIISEAKANAEKMTAEATAQSEQIINEAKGNAEKIVLQLRSPRQGEPQPLPSPERGDAKPNNNRVPDAGKLAKKGTGDVGTLYRSRSLP